METGRAGDDAYREVASQHHEAIEQARRIVAHDRWPDHPDRIAIALVAIDDAMREALTDDR